MPVLPLITDPDASGFHHFLLFPFPSQGDCEAKPAQTKCAGKVGMRVKTSGRRMRPGAVAGVRSQILRFAQNDSRAWVVLLLSAPEGG